jgi:sensor histidine kinase YesM
LTNSFRTNIFRFALPVTFVVMTVFAQGLYLPPFDQQKLLIFIRSLFFIVLTFELGRIIVKMIQKKFPLLRQTKRRLLFSYTSSVLLAFAIISISTLISRWISPKSFSFGYESLFNLVQSLWFGLLIAAPGEMMYAYELSFKNEMELNELEKLNLKTRFEALQAKMNPHFLFNTLNTLSSLIVKDPSRAEKLSVEMAFVYRYMLQNIEEPLISLRNELDFTRSFILLLKVRFENELLIDINVDDNCLDKKLPPLSLQLLVENAVKHNVFSKQAPLCISIKTVNESYIRVENFINMKQKVDSPGTGLSSLKMRYELLGEEPVAISNKDGQFMVTLKLI